MTYKWNFNKSKKRRLEHTFDSTDPEDDMYIETIDNHLYFYSSFNTKNCFELVKHLHKLDKKIQEKIKKNNKKKKPEKLEEEDIVIHLHIHSGGGDLYGAFAVIDKIRILKTPVYSYINGIAASAATLLSVVCKKRFIYRNSYMLIHQLSSCFWGTFAEIDDEYKNNCEFMRVIKNIYKEHTRIHGNSLDKLLKHDLWWNSKICLENGLVDKIL